MRRHSKPRDMGITALSPVRTESAGEPQMTNSSQLTKQRFPWSEDTSQRRQCMPTSSMRFTNYR